MFVANNWLLLGICVFIALATTWPKVSEWLWGERLTVGAELLQRLARPRGPAPLRAHRRGHPHPLAQGHAEAPRRGLPRAPRGRCLGPRRRTSPSGATSASPRSSDRPHLRQRHRVGSSGSVVSATINVGRSLAWVDGHLPPGRDGPLRVQRRRPRAGVLARRRGAHEAPRASRRRRPHAPRLAQPPTLRRLHRPLRLRHDDGGLRGRGVSLRGRGHARAGARAFASGATPCATTAPRCAVTPTAARCTRKLTVFRDGPRGGADLARALRLHRAAGDADHRGEHHHRASARTSTW
jgi:hypothetical protein